MTNETKALRQMFPGMDEGDLAKLTSVAELHTYPADTILCQEGQVEKRIVAHQDRTLAAGVADLPAHRLRNAAQRFLLRYGLAQRAVDPDAGDLERLGIDIRTVKGLYVNGDGFGNRQPAEIIHTDDTGGNLQQGVFLCVEAAGFDIDDDGQKTPEAICNARHNGPRSTGRRG